MADIVSPEKRSQMMAGIGSRDTKPELKVRKALYKKGFRYRINQPNLPGKPDIFLPRFKTAIFVHGCFWHGHDCKYFKLPKTNSEFWSKKISSNKNRDHQVQCKLANLGIRTATVWECETKLPPTEFENRIAELADWITLANA